MALVSAVGAGSDYFAHALTACSITEAWLMPSLFDSLISNFRHSVVSRNEDVVLFFAAGTVFFLFMLHIVKEWLDNVKP